MIQSSDSARELISRSGLASFDLSAFITLRMPIKKGSPASCPLFSGQAQGEIRIACVLE